MELILNTQIRSHNKKLIYANKGDKVDVIFDNTKTTPDGIITGHFICTLKKESTFDIIDDQLQFIVFISQVEAIILKNSDNTHSYYYL